MKRTTISLPDGLQEALEAYRRDQEAQPALSAVIQAALREYLIRRGYGLSVTEAFRITPAPAGSGHRDVSAVHDRHFAESATRR